MGQKVHPYGFRIGYTKPWKSRWFVTRDYDKLLLEDVRLKNELKGKLKSAGVRAHLDDRGEKVNFKIREAQLQKVPYMLVVGDREAENGTVSVRNRRHGDQGARSVEQFLAGIKALIEAKTPVE